MDLKLSVQVKSAPKAKKPVAAKQPKKSQPKAAKVVKKPVKPKKVGRPRKTPLKTVGHGVFPLGGGLYVGGKLKK